MTFVLQRVYAGFPCTPHLLHVRCVCSPGNGVGDIGGTVRDELAWMLLTVARPVRALCWRGGDHNSKEEKENIVPAVNSKFGASRFH